MKHILIIQAIIGYRLSSFHIYYDSDRHINIYQKKNKLTELNITYPYRYFKYGKVENDNDNDNDL